MWNRGNMEFPSLNRQPQGMRDTLVRFLPVSQMKRQRDITQHFNVILMGFAAHHYVLVGRALFFIAYSFEFYSDESK